MIRVLFADDEAPILEALQNVLRRYRRRFDAVFALGGAEAARRVAETPFDVVVTDLRMPGFDGAQLLAHVRAVQPAAARLVLSGHGDRDALSRALPLAQRILAKPCDPEQLRSAVERAHALKERLRSVPLLGPLPPPPDTYFALARAMLDPTVSAEALAPIVEQDGALVARVLHLANSVYFGLSQPVVSVSHALAYLGPELLKGLALSAHMFTLPPGEPEIDVDGLQARALSAARLARRMLAHDPRSADDAFAAAMVHDLGRLRLALDAPATWAAIRDEAQASGRRLVDLERAHLGVTHAEIGAQVLDAWGLPLSIVEAVAFHHEPARIGDGDRSVLAAVHAASVFVDRDDTLDPVFLRSAGRLAELDGWTSLAADELRGLSL